MKHETQLMPEYGFIADKHIIIPIFPFVKPNLKIFEK